MTCVYLKRAPIANPDDRPLGGSSHPWLPVNAASLLRRNWRLEAAITGTLEACRHIVEATILVASQCSILAAFWKE
jgi:hypothetical protein